MDPHCKPDDDCHCSEKDEKTINKLFYETHPIQFEEIGGNLSDGKITLYFHSYLTDCYLAASLSDTGELIVSEDVPPGNRDR